MAGPLKERLQHIRQVGNTTSSLKLTGFHLAVKPVSALVGITSVYGSKGFVL